MLSVAQLLADSIKRISVNRSVSEIYEQQEAELAESQSGNGGPLFSSLEDNDKRDQPKNPDKSADDEKKTNEADVDAAFEPAAT